MKSTQAESPIKKPGPRSPPLQVEEIIDYFGRVHKPLTKAGYKDELGKLQAQSGNISGATAGVETTSTITNKETDGTTEFTDQDVVSVVKPSNLMTLPKSVIATDGVYQDIKTYLAKPMVFASGTLLTASSKSIMMEDVTRYIYNTAHPVWMDKLKGYYGIKATIVFNLKVNASRFDQGLYLLAFLPYGGNPTNSAFYNNAYCHSYVQVSTLMHVKCDINCDSAVQLRIPWNTCQSFMGLVPWIAGRVGSPGNIYFYGLSNVTTLGGSGSFGYTLYCHLEDVELFGATVPQSGLQVTQKKKKKDLLTTEMESDRTISNALKLGATISTALSAIPTLTVLATPMSWMLDAASRAAYAWGFAAPRINDPTSRMTKWSNPYLSNYNKKSTAQNFALSSTNSVGFLNGWSGTSEDEMSLAFLFQRSAMFRFFTITTGTAAGTIVFNESCTPNNAYETTVDSGATLVNETPICYISSLFNLWRGSLIYRFTIVKTEFHRARLLVCFVPTANVVAPTVTYTNTAYLMREIIDIREGNEFEVTIPYMSNSQFLNVSGGQNNGYIQIYVVDQLETSITGASDTITIFCDIRGGPDFEVASRYSSPSLGRAGFVFPATLQSGMMVGGSEDPCAIIATTIGTTSVPGRSYEFAAACTGEAVDSVSQLLKAGGVVNYESGYAVTTPQWNINPFAIKFSEIIATVPTKLVYIDPFSNIAPLYCMMRGSMRITTYFSTAGVECRDFKMCSFHDDVIRRKFLSIGTTTIPNLYYLGTRGNLLIKTITDSCIVADVPQMTKYHATTVFAEIGIDATMQGSATFETGRKTRLNLSMNDPLDGNTNIWTPFFHRAVGDDFRLGGFLSIPPRPGS